MKKTEPGPGQESVWDYPRPPKMEDSAKTVRIVFNSKEIVHSDRSKRVLETSHPPVYYIPQEDIQMKYLQKISGTTYCEWKGQAHYFDVVVGKQKAEKAAWCYPDLTEPFESMAGYVAFYGHKMQGCYVGDEKVDAQKGGFYGGWITSNIVGPFKGKPGSAGW
ncbi:Uncharacterized conserved protein, DUF427 family [Fodinibius salinus]|uniref:Uncharacterized conserved protein, DUF427 family n=1 Tax=Fodinibius salinus TaxID=860790 RepID=A0A5D3YMJ5_9BACT|nr:DUF427 domain-containing protein [Fodinibius salinus]TYP93359.1 Uncharacterized conserved protein, DUF427 family [Fodinibius salinus]